MKRILNLLGIGLSLSTAHGMKFKNDACLREAIQSGVKYPSEQEFYSLPMTKVSTFFQPVCTPEVVKWIQEVTEGAVQVIDESVGAAAAAS